MPWKISDVDRHKRGLTYSQKKRWIFIANAILHRSGNEVMAIRTANSRCCSEEIAFMIETIITSYDRQNLSGINSFDIGNRNMISITPHTIAKRNWLKLKGKKKLPKEEPCQGIAMNFVEPYRFRQKQEHM